MNKLFVQVERAEDLIGRVDDYFTQPEQKPKPITNADRIRAMTDEELAGYIRVFFPEVCPPVNCPGEDYCYNCWLDWLKQEAKI